MIFNTQSILLFKFSQIIENRDPNTIDKRFFGKLVIFLYEIFSKGDKQYQYFIEQLRKNSSFINSLIQKVFQVFPVSKNIRVDELISRRETFPMSNDPIGVVKSSDFQLDMLKQESDIYYENMGQYVVITSIRFLLNEMISKGSDVTKTLQILFNNDKNEKTFLVWLERFARAGDKLRTSLEGSLQSFFQEIYDSNNFLGNSTETESLINKGKYTRRTLIINELAMAKRLSKYRVLDGNRMIDEEASDVKEEDLHITEKGFYKLLDVNLFGYGHDFQFDSQELYHSMKLCNYKPEFIYQSTILIRKFNLFNSVVDIEVKYYEAWIRLFCFIASLGKSLSDK
jgi:hypothetical protein